MRVSSLIPTDKIIERLRYENPWWVNKQIPEASSSMSKHLYFNFFYLHVIEKSVVRVLVLLGPRHVSKTEMLFNSVQLFSDAYCQAIDRNSSRCKTFLLIQDAYGIQPDVTIHQSERLTK
jgi:hypothetical protein